MSGGYDEIRIELVLSDQSDRRGIEIEETENNSKTNEETEGKGYSLVVQ